MKFTAKFYPSTNAGKILGDASVTIREESLGDLTLKKIRVIQGNDGAPFVALPQFGYEKDGDKKYATVIWASGDWKQFIDAAVLKAYEDSLTGAKK